VLSIVYPIWLIWPAGFGDVLDERIGPHTVDGSAENRAFDHFPQTGRHNVVLNGDPLIRELGDLVYTLPCCLHEVRHSGNGREILAELTQLLVRQTVEHSLAYVREQMPKVDRISLDNDAVAVVVVNESLDL